MFLINSFQFHPWVEILNDDVVEDYDVEENEEDLGNDQDPDNNQIPYIGHDSDNDQIPYIDQDPDNDQIPDNEQDMEDRIICHIRPLKITTSWIAENHLLHC